MVCVCSRLHVFYVVCSVGVAIFFTTSMQQGVVNPTLGSLRCFHVAFCTNHHNSAPR
jgi:hypothetical protein